MGIFCDNLLAIGIDDNLSPIIVIAQNSFNLSSTNIAFVEYFVIVVYLVVYFVVYFVINIAFDKLLR